MKRTMTVMVSAMLVAAAMQAAPQGQKYVDWAKSPQAYFMTAAEKAQWDKLATDQEAEAFVNDFVAKRGGQAFVAETEKRAAMADKYLSFGKTKGSETIGGKMLVLFGAPASVAINDRAAKHHYNAAPPDPGSYAASGRSAGGAPVEDGGRTNATLAPGQSFRDFSFTFYGKSVPGLNREQLDTTVTVDLGSGKAALKDKKQQADLDTIFESVAAASVVKK
ncbi:MAG: hypothetical protein JO197_20065 [Acidobacteria bacterium]|nr:hypothetical protein [Acidobacteriota bacterium]MBV9474604.1 hypothetical protein [Acidobacteriota bacterium]